MSLPSIVAYFAAGAAVDFLIAKYYLFLTGRRRVLAPVFAVLVTLAGFAVTATLIWDRNIAGAVAFALGNGLGTWLALGDRRGK